MTTDSQVHDTATTMAETYGATTSRTNAPSAIAPEKKPKKFTCVDFKRWKQKTFFYLTTLCLQWFTFEEAPEEISVEDLIVRLRIKVDSKAIEIRSKENSSISRTNIVEYDHNNSKKWKKDGQKNNQPKKKFKEKCFNCGKIGHKSMDCRAPKKGKKKDQANMAEPKKEMNYMCVMLSECNLVGNPREWWMDSGATHHVCANKELFVAFALVQVEEKIYMANSTTAKVEGT
ncbi:putative glucan endo-1,3-beta-glucosidase A-like [Capsicum annuum]|nr:putative glucan endo-1,3-beta-glucosidase A-like [Capsicum annuum]